MSCWDKEQLENMLEDVVNELDLSELMVEELANYLSDLDNLKETGHFPKISIKEYTGYHTEMTLYDFIGKGREYIRQFLMSKKANE